MSISSEITSMGENLKKDYQSIANLGADLTNVDKNIENIAELLDGVYDRLPKTEFEEGESVTLENTLKGKLDYENGVVVIGQSEQDGTPTPDNEVSIQCVTGNQDVVVKDGNNNTIATYQLSLGDIELNAIGNYKDELIYDVDEDKVYKNEKIGKKEITSSTSITYDTTLTNVSRFRTSISDSENATENNSAYCNIFINKNGYSLDEQHFYIYNKNMFFFMPNTIAQNLTQLQTWLSSNNMYALYRKTTSTEILITDTTLINQVKALYNAHSNNGTTIITSNGNLPMIIKVRALKGE